MNLDTTLFISPLLVSIAVAVALLIAAWMARSDPIAPWFAGLMFAALIWTVGYVFEIVTPGLEDKVAWANFQFIGVVGLPLLWFEVIRRYVGHKRFAGVVLAAIVTWAVISLAVVAFNPGHAFRGVPMLDVLASPPGVIPSYGWYWSSVLMPGVYALSAAVAIMLGAAFWRERRTPRARQYLLLILASALPLIAGTLFVIEFKPLGRFNATTAVLSISGAIMAWVLLHYRLWNVAPLARWGVVEGLADAVIVVDTRNRIVDANPPARRLFRSLDESAVGRPIAEVLSLHRGILRSLGEIAAGESSSGVELAEFSIALPPEASDVEREAERRRDTSFAAAVEREPDVRMFTVSVSEVRNRYARLLGRSIVLRDVTEIRELRREVERLSTTDRLTDLLTRGSFLAAAENELVRARHQGSSMWLVCVDLDHFSLVNRVFGAGVGDDVLRAVASVCRRTTRPFDLVGRFSATFLILMPYLSADEAHAAGERLRQAIENFVVFRDGQAVTVTASVGYAGREAVGDEAIGDFLDRAEAALKMARADGGNRVVGHRFWSSLPPAGEGDVGLRADDGETSQSDDDVRRTT